MYYADYGKFPTSSVNGLVHVTDNGGKDISWGGEFSDNSAQHYVYMKVMPNEKILKNTQYCYVTDPSGTKFALFAMLENTTDSQCIMSGAVGAYSHCSGKTYCFSYISPNAVVSDFNGFIP